MLVSMLYDLLPKDVSHPEVTSIKLCPKGEGVWDTLGYYNPNLPVKITICEHEIEEYSRQISKNLKLNEKQVSWILKELVRLHEHSHAILHTGDFNSFCGVNLKDTPLKVRLRFKRGYNNLPKDINEPITEFITYSVICRTEFQTAKQIFIEVDKTSPPYYQTWKQITALIDNKSKPNRRDYIFFIPRLVHLARESDHNDFKQFFIEVQQNCQSLHDTYSLLKLCKKLL
jgi:hypothetical protein